MENLNIRFACDLTEVLSMIAIHSFDYVIVNVGSVDWFSGQALNEFVFPSEVVLLVMASDSSMRNALDAIESAEREVVEKPVKRDNLPFQLHPVTERFDCHFMGWYGVFLCRPRGVQVASSSVLVDPVSPVLDQSLSLIHI